MKENHSYIEVEVCYALAKHQTLLKVRVQTGSTIAQALTASNILKMHPEIDLAQQKIGVFGKLKSLQTVLAEGDRVEIYRPLQVDPKLARQHRVAKARASDSREGRKWLARRAMQKPETNSF